MDPTTYLPNFIDWNTQTDYQKKKDREKWKQKLNK